MDIIYSRRMIRVKKFKVIVMLILLLVLLFCIFVKLIIYPTFISVCEYRAKSIAINVTNNEISKVMDKYSYEDLINVRSDEKGNVSFIETHVINMNKIIAEITKNIQKEFTDGNSSSIKVNLGVFTGTRIFSGFGPKININVVSAGNIEINVKSEFFSVGVNQSIHRIYLDINSDVDISTPISSLKSNINMQTLLGETVIVGNTPGTYYELDNLNSSQTVDVIQ